MANDSFSLRNVFTALGRMLSNSKPGEFIARNSIEKALGSTNREIAARPAIEPTVISKKGLGRGTIFNEEGLGKNYHKYLERETLRHGRYTMYDRMDTDLIASAIDVYANEATQKNQDGKVIGVNSSSRYIQDELEGLLEDLGINNYRSWSIIRNMVKYGDHFVSLKLDSVAGVVELLDLDAISVYRLEEKGTLIGYVQDIDVLKSAVQNANVSSATTNPYVNLNTLSLPYLTGDRAEKENENSLITFLKYEMLHFKLRGNGLFMPYGTCIKHDTRIETEYGYKEIKNINKGDKVWSLDFNGNRILSNVLDVVCSGTKPVYKISTKHNFIEASKEHQIMIIDKFGNFSYKTPLQLQIGDLFATAKKKNENKKINIDKTAPTSVIWNAYWKNINNIPEYVDKDFAQLFGFLIGDGWIDTNRVCFAAGEHQSINEKYISLLEKYSGNNVGLVKDNISYLDYTQVRCSSKMLSIILRRMGFIGKATTKRLPSWIFECSEEIKKSFLKGLVDSDGSLFIDKWNCLRYSIELNNKDLISDIKVLVQSLGLKSGKISKRTRTSSLINDRVITPTTSSYYFYWFDTEIIQTKKYNKCKTNEYIIEPIIGIELQEGNQQTWDINVDSVCHNFYANGIVVHNSPLDAAVDTWKKLDLLFDSLIIYRLNRAPTRLVFYVDVGNNQGADAENIVKKQINALAKKEYFDPTGKLNERYQLLDMNANLYIPMQKGGATKVEQLAGVSDVGKIEDVEFLNNRLFSALKVPKSFLGYEGDVSSKGMLSQQNVTFSKAIQNIQEDFLEAIKDLCFIHLAIRGISSKTELKSFKLIMSRPSYVEEKAKIEVENSLLGLASSYLGMGVNRRWVAKHIMHKTEDEIEQMFEIDPTLPQQPGMEGGMGAGMGAPMGSPDMGMGGGMPSTEEMPTETAPTGTAPPAMPAAPEAGQMGSPLIQNRQYIGGLLLETQDTVCEIKKYSNHLKLLEESIEEGGIMKLSDPTRKTSMAPLLEGKKSTLTEPEEIFNT